MSKVITIPQSITSIDPERIYQVQILKGAPEALVSCRELRNKYETNREIKTWSFYFLLKAITTSPFIKNWRTQRKTLLTWCQMNERTFYRYLDELEKKKLANVDRNYNIHLCSWEAAAHILDIAYAGKISIPFNPHKYEGKQSFQYLLRAEEIISNQNDQHKALMTKLDKNPLLKNDLLLMLLRQGADEQRLLKDSAYLRERLLQLQIKLFKDGSEFLSYAFNVRADINRGVKKIQEHHHYKSKLSVTYIKKRMVKLGVITIRKIKVISEARARLYIPDTGKEKGVRDGYKWFNDQKQTALILTDQIQINYETTKQGQRLALTKAA